MKIVVIGSGGFLGKPLCKYFLSQGRIVTGIDIADVELEGDYTHLTVDLARDEFDFPENVDAVFYLSQSPYYRDFPENMENLFMVNSIMPAKIAHMASQNRAKFFCFASTGNVYAQSFFRLKETDPKNRSNAYALSKITGEDALNLLHPDGMKILSVRFFGLFGPGQKAMLPFALKNSVLEGKPIILQANPTETTDDSGLKVSFLYLHDTIQILEKLMNVGLAGKELPPALNVGGESAIPIKKFANEIGLVLGKEPVYQTSATERSFDLIADISLLKKYIDHSFTTFEQAVRESF